MLAKIINGRLQYAPRNYRTDNGQLIINFNKNEELMKQYGYKEVIDIRPDYNEKTQYIRILDYDDGEVITINYGIVDKEPLAPTGIEVLETQINENAEAIFNTQMAVDFLLMGNDTSLEGGE